MLSRLISHRQAQVCTSWNGTGKWKVSCMPEANTPAPTNPQEMLIYLYYKFNAILSLDVECNLHKWKLAVPGLLLCQPGLCWTQEWPGWCCDTAASSGTDEKVNFGSTITPTLTCSQTSTTETIRERISCCSFGQGELWAGGGCREGPLGNAFTTGSSMQVLKGWKEHRADKDQHKDQGDLKAVVSFSQWLFKDSEYLDSFSFPVRNQRIFLEMFLLFRHLSNSGSL